MDKRTKIIFCFSPYSIIFQFCEKNFVVYNIKCFFRSRKTPQKYKLLSQDFLTLSVISIIACVIEQLFLKSNCCLQSDYFFSENEYSLSFITFSEILLKLDVKEIDLQLFQSFLLHQSFFVDRYSLDSFQNFREFSWFKHEVSQFSKWYFETLLNCLKSLIGKLDRVISFVVLLCFNIFLNLIFSCGLNEKRIVRWIQKIIMVFLYCWNYFTFRSFGISQKNWFMVFAVIFGLLVIVSLTSRFLIDQLLYSLM